MNTGFLKRLVNSITKTEQNVDCCRRADVKYCDRSMSEFKYECPVCGQHMMCDSSRGGSVMECPTCFQKITAPQAPTSDDPKFILTGTKVGERPVPLIAQPTANVAPAAKSFPLGLILLVIAIRAAGAGVFVFREKLFKAGQPQHPPVATNETAKTPALAKPAVVAPPANDTNWMLSLDAVTIPDATVAGRIHAQDFIVERANFQNRTLTLRAGMRGPVEFGAMIHFGGAQAEALSGKTINVSTNADKAARVTLRWKEGSGTVQKKNYDDSYALRLEFGALANNRLPGKIYLCTPDAEKSYLLGTFNADARKPKPKPPKK